jgi:hypothetical protein
MPKEIALEGDLIGHNGIIIIVGLRERREPWEH